MYLQEVYFNMRRIFMSKDFVNKLEGITRQLDYISSSLLVLREAIHHSPADASSYVGAASLLLELAEYTEQQATDLLQTAMKT